MFDKLIITRELTINDRIFEIIENNVQEYATTGGHQLHKAVHFYDIIRILRLIRCDLQKEAKADGD